LNIPILQTKILPEKTPGGLIPRERLIGILKENADKKAIAVIGGAGFGKTTLIKDFLNRTNRKFCWFRIDESDDNLLNFIVYIISSIRLLYPSFGEAALKLSDSIKPIGTGKKTTDVIINSIGTAIVNDAVKNIKEEVYLVLDDLHLLPKEDWVKKIMLFFIDNLPDNFHIIITSREHLVFETGKLKAKRKYFELLNKDLKLSAEEFASLARLIYNYKLEPHEADVINNKIGGWITGLHLYLQSDTDKSNLILRGEILPGSLYEYFAEDIFASLDEPTRKFLIETSMLEDFTAETCDHLLNTTGCSRALNELLRRNIFIEKSENIDSGEPLYNYQQLFKDFLHMKFDESLSLEEKFSLMNKYGDYYLYINEPMKAIKFYLEAENYDKAIELILENINEAGEKGNLDTADKWLRAIPDYIADKNPYLIYYKACHYKIVSGNNETALEHFYRAIELFEKQNDRKFLISAYTHIAELLIGSGKTQEALKILNSLLKEAKSNESKVTLMYWKAIAFYHLSEYTKAQELLEKALELANTANLATIKNAILNTLGNICLVRGDYTQALFYYEVVVSKINNIYNKFETLLNIVQTLANSGKFDKARKVLDEAENIKYTYSASFFQINFYVSALELYYSAGDYEKTIEICNELLLIALDRNLNHPIFLSYFTIARCHFFLKDYRKAGETLKYATEYMDAQNETDSLYYEFWETVINKELKLRKNMEPKLKDYSRQFESKEMHFEQSYSMYHLADYYYKAGAFDKAEHMLTEALNIAEENDYTFKFQREVFLNRELFDFAIENKIKQPLIYEIFNCAFRIPEIEWLSPESRKRLHDEIFALYDINLSLLGIPRIFVRGSLIPDNAWLRKNRKYIFIYIILNQKYSLTKDQLLLEFYPDSNPENADNIFYQLMSNIRSVLKVYKSGEHGKHPNPELLTYHDKILKLNPDFFYYADINEFEEHYKALKDDITGEDRLFHLKSAIELYKGDFLEGTYEAWIDEPRIKYQNIYFSLLKEIIRILKTRNEPEEIIKYSELQLKVDNLDEEAYMNILDAEAKLKNHVNIGLRIRQITAVYRKELDDEPPKNLKDKINELKSALLH
jgi:ATP/maltotriose-dependent transcriptional regulator MalT